MIRFTLPEFEFNMVCSIWQYIKGLLFLAVDNFLLHAVCSDFFLTLTRSIGNYFVDLEVLAVLLHVF